MTIVRDAPAPALRPAIGVTARRDRWVRSGAEVLLAAALTLVTWWWATGGGVTDLGGWATGLTSVGRLTGLLAVGAAARAGLLMARRAGAGARVRPGPARRACTGWSASPRSTGCSPTSA